MKASGILIATALVMLLSSACREPGQEAGVESRIIADSTAIDRVGQRDSALARARELYERGEFVDARTAYAETLERTRELNDIVGQVRSLTGMTRAARKLDAYAEARDLGTRALGLARSHDLEGELSTILNVLGLIAWTEGRLKDAEERFGQAARAARSVGDEAALARASGNMALVHMDLGRLSEARASLLVFREAGRRLGNGRYQANASLNLGALEIWTGNPAVALEHLTDALDLYRTLGDPSSEVEALGQLAIAYTELGRPGEAFAALDSALALARMGGLRIEEASGLEIQADLHRAAGDYRRALRLYSQAEEIHAELGLDYERGVDLRDRATIYRALGDLERAEELATQALQLHQRVGAPFEELDNRLLLAEIANEAGDARQVEDHLQQARNLAVGLSARSARIAAALTAARIADRNDRPDDVLRTLDSVATDLSLGGYAAEWEASALRASALLSQGRLDSAVAAGRLAVAAVERVRDSYGSGFLRTGYVTERVRAYADLVLALLRLDRTEEAFAVADAARGRALLDHLRGARVEASRPAIAAFEEAEELLARIDELIERLDSFESPPEQDERGARVDPAARPLIEELEATRSKYEALLVRAAETDPRGAALLRSGHIEPDDIRAVLQAEEALLAYFVTPDRVLLFVLTAEGSRPFELNVSEEALASRVRLARDLLSGPETVPEHAIAVLRRLYDDLLAPAVAADAIEGVERLIVVPHGTLAYLPFAALMDDRGRYLIEDYAFLYLPKAAALPVIREESGRGDVSGSHARPEAFAPFPDDLPATKIELERLSGLLADVRTRLGSDADEAAVRRALSRPGLVHVATHGVMNPRNPMFSRIELAGEGGGAADNGRLEVHELLQLSVRSPLVFLSGCETGVGAAWHTGFSKGEDYTTLGQAFLLAGAENVIATLWRIEDAGGAAMAEAFYRQRNRLAPVEALAAAQRDLMTSQRYGSPYYWAAYTLSGAGGSYPAQERGKLSVRR